MVETLVLSILAVALWIGALLFFAPLRRHIRRLEREYGRRSRQLPYDRECEQAELDACAELEQRNREVLR